jgi:hypothetical protein
MSEESTEETSAFKDLAEKGREKLSQAQDGAKDALSAATEYIRANPWSSVAVAAVLGGVIVALAKPGKPESPHLDAIRDFLDDAQSRIPTKKQVRALADDSGIPDFVKGLRKKLNLS